ncbi:MAG: hypothetical protein RL417_1004 [Pseudomonadota bacterium]|jgi:hypothetical protein
MYRHRPRPSVTESGSYRVNNSALKVTEARRVHDLRVGQQAAGISLLNLVSISLIVLSLFIAVAAVIFV